MLKKLLLFLRSTFSVHSFIVVNDTPHYSYYNSVIQLYTYVSDGHGLGAYTTRTYGAKWQLPLVSTTNSHTKVLL